MSINYADIAVVAILFMCAARSKRRGITYIAVSIIAKLISIFLSVSLYGPIARLIRETQLFTYIKEQAAEIVDVDTLLGLAGFSEQMMANDNSEIYKLFRVETFEDYASSYIANIAVNIISVLIVYLVCSSIIKALFRANRSFSRLPVIRHVNGFAGVIIGLAEGVLIIWLLVIALIFFALQGKLLNIYEMLLSSKLAIYFLQYNIFAAAIFKVKP